MTNEELWSYCERISPQFWRAIEAVHAASERFYVDGEKVSEVIDHALVYELGKFLGCGQCYEAAALMMLTLIDHPSACLVQGTAERSNETHERCDHAWVIFAEGGVWFAVDPAWLERDWCVPLKLYAEWFRPEMKFVCRHRDFWRLPVCRDLHGKMHWRTNSYLFSGLFIFRSEDGKYGFDLVRSAGRLNVRCEKGEIHKLIQAAICGTNPRFAPELAWVI